MHPFPFKVTVAIPTYIEEMYGRNSTNLPHGLISSIRIPRHEVDVIDKAIDICDFGISRGGFIRVAAARVAAAIVKGHEEYLRAMKEEQDDRSSRSIQSTKANHRVG